jgi:DNA-binding XRE family transcriptional regulator
VRYKRVYVPGRGTIGAHRAIMERLLRRKLAGHAEQVHHVNGDPTDNRPENLEVLTAVAHRAKHHPPRSPLAAVRVRAGKSRAEAAAELDISERHLARLENGKTPLRRMHALAFAEYYKVDVDDIDEVAA